MEMRHLGRDPSLEIEELVWHELKSASTPRSAGKRFLNGCDRILRPARASLQPVRQCSL